MPHDIPNLVGDLVLGPLEPAARRHAAVQVVSSGAGALVSLLGARAAAEILYRVADAALAAQPEA